ncbi:hypothetical protein X743_02160 [Mesorhizobium sp. LNHC252B00]|nr:hypothetical protein X743_02160 [Mesorhizobium sp. LNHC252B00]
MESSPWFESDLLEACPPIYPHEYNKGRPGSTTSHPGIDIGGAIVTARSPKSPSVDNASDVMASID